MIKVLDKSFSIIFNECAVENYELDDGWDHCQEDGTDCDPDLGWPHTPASADHSEVPSLVTHELILRLGAWINFIAHTLEIGIGIRVEILYAVLFYSTDQLVVDPEALARLTGTSR